MIPSTSCVISSTNTEKYWKYNEHYLGEKDADHRKSRLGENHWSGAKSIECYNGQFYRDTMHGTGEYRWRYLGPDGYHLTYEGYFFGNNMHGYGTISYPDGKAFRVSLDFYVILSNT
ncbi:hypothetical protein ACJJTC_012790 [Scirpophaga incertulas]